MPGQQIQKGTTYVNYPNVGNSQVTAENLNDHVDNAILLPGAISAQLEGVPEDNDYVLAERGGSLFKYALSSIKDLFAAYFPLRSGSTMTGELTLSSSTPSAAAVAASKGYVDATVAAATLSGAIVMWGGSSAPTGWLECNGQSTAGYASLIAIYGTNVPDLRGEFIRGWDHGKGVDPGRGIRSLQGQDVQPHTHPITTYSYLRNFEGGAALAWAGTQSSNTGSSGGSETRPRNIALMYIVKT